MIPALDCAGHPPSRAKSSTRARPRPAGFTPAGSAGSRLEAMTAPATRRISSRRGSLIRSLWRSPSFILPPTSTEMDLTFSRIRCAAKPETISTFASTRNIPKKTMPFFASAMKTAQPDSRALRQHGRRWRRVLQRGGRQCLPQFRHQLDPPVPQQPDQRVPAGLQPGQLTAPADQCGQNQ